MKSRPFGHDIVIWDSPEVLNSRDGGRGHTNPPLLACVEKYK